MKNACLRALALSAVFCSALAAPAIARAADESIDDIACSPDAFLRLSVTLGNSAFEIPEDPRLLRMHRSGYNDGVQYLWTFSVSDGGKNVGRNGTPKGPSCSIEGGGWDGEKISVQARYQLSVDFSCSTGSLSDMYGDRMSCKGTPGRAMTIRDLKAILGPGAKVTATAEDLKAYRETLVVAANRARDRKRIEDAKAALNAGDATLRTSLKQSCQLVSAGVLADAQFDTKAAEARRLERYATPIVKAQLEVVRAKLASQMDALRARFEKLASANKSDDYGKQQEAWQEIRELIDPVFNSTAEELSVSHGGWAGAYGPDGREAKDYAPYGGNRPWSIEVAYGDANPTPSFQICRGFQTDALGQSQFCTTAPLLTAGDGRSVLNISDYQTEFAIPFDGGALAKTVFNEVLRSDEDSAQAAQLCPLVLAPGEYTAARAIEAETAGSKPGIHWSTANEAPKRHWTVLPAQ